MTLSPACEHIFFLPWKSFFEPALLEHEEPSLLTPESTEKSLGCLESLLLSAAHPSARPELPFTGMKFGSMRLSETPEVSWEVSAVQSVNTRGGV